MSARHVPIEISVRKDSVVERQYSLGKWWEIAIAAGPESNQGNTIAMVHMGGPGATINSKEAVEVSAARFVMAWNAHQYLVTALRDVTDALRTYGPEYVHGEPKEKVVKRALAALAMAESK